MFLTVPETVFIITITTLTSVILLACLFAYFIVKKRRKDSSISDEILETEPLKMNNIHTKSERNEYAKRISKKSGTVHEPPIKNFMIIKDKEYHKNEISNASMIKYKEFDQSMIVLEKEVGKGNFGKVFKGKVVGGKADESGRIIAVKVIKGLVGKTEIDDFRVEIKIMSLVKPNLNLVSMIGSWTSDLEENGQCWLLLEFCTYGDLKNYLISMEEQILSGNENDSINSRCLLLWSFHVANGMRYLAENKIMHGDLAARNILMSDNPLNDGTVIAKVADFGLAKRFYDNITYQKESRLKVPWKWMALEYLTRDIFTLNSDVWSFGVLFWEILSLGRTPYGHQEYHEIVEKLKNGYRLKRPEESDKILSWNAKRVFEIIARSCFEADPLKRVPFSSIVGKLEGELSRQEIEHFKRTLEAYTP